MSSVAKIEAAIQKLGVADQRIIARHLGRRLAAAENPVGISASDEGIPFLPPFSDSSARSEARRRKASQRV